MRWMQSLRMRLRALTRADAVDRELADEMREHVDHLVEEHVARGMTLDEARAAARREFGPVTQLTEASRDARGISWLSDAVNDVRYGARLMRRSPGFAITATL